MSNGNGTPFGVDSGAAQYWNGKVTRREIQDAFDSYAKQSERFMLAFTQFDAALAFIMHKLTVTPEEVNKWLAEQAAKMEAEAQTAEATAKLAALDSKTKIPN